MRPGNNLNRAWGCLFPPSPSSAVSNAIVEDESTSIASPRKSKLPRFYSLYKPGSAGPKYFLIAPKQQTTLFRAFGFNSTTSGTQTGNDWFKQKLKLQLLCDKCHCQVSPSLL